MQPLAAAAAAGVPIVLASLIVSGCVSAPRFGVRPDRESAPPAVMTVEEGTASYYAEEFNGRRTANGETYDMNQLTAAHRTLPFNTAVRVTNAGNGKSLVVRINDRGPFKDDRIIDLSLAAAKQLEMIGHGTARVRLEVLQLGDTTGIDEHYAR